MSSLPNLVQRYVLNYRFVEEIYQCTCSHVFGLNAKVSNNVIYIDDQTIIYPSGTQMVFYEVDQKSQKFLSVNETDGMSTMAMSSSGKSLALAIKGPEAIEGQIDDKSAFIVLYDLLTLKKKKVFTLPHDIVVKVRTKLLQDPIHMFLPRDRISFRLSSRRTESSFSHYLELLTGKYDNVYY
jgi:hypothetical protein